MGRLIAAISDTITTRLHRGTVGNLVAGLATLPLRALQDARLLPARLSGWMPACLPAAVTGRMQAVGVTGAAARFEAYGSSRRWSHGGKRPVEPACRAKSGRF